MKELTFANVLTLGFEQVPNTYEDGVEYNYMYPGLFMELQVIFKYSDNGELKYRVDLDNWELENVGINELATLIKVLPKAGVPIEENEITK